jgi:hypothetical protein
MSFFQRKILGEEPVLASLLVTFGQSIDAVEKANAVQVPQAWDLFINKVGILTDNKFISENTMDSIVHLSGFQIGRDLVIDLVKLRKFGSVAANFQEELQPLLEKNFSPNLSFGNSSLGPKDFIDYIVAISKSKYPAFGSSSDDQKFYAIMGIFIATVFRDTDEDKSTAKTFRRLTSFTLGLQWYAEWNIAKELN